MGLRDVTREIISLVEKKTGLPVRVAPDHTLKTPSAVRVARGNSPFHMVLWNPAADALPDYGIAWECGAILRMFDVPADRRRTFSATRKGRDAVNDLLRESGIASRLGVPGRAMDELREQLFQGLMLQLRSVPVGFRVDSWIRSQFPQLIDLQEASVKAQLQTNSRVLEPQFRLVSPEKIFKANVAMNASFAEYWAGVMQEPRFALPYKASKYWTIGHRLTEICERVPDEPTQDVRLVDEWATELGLHGWYEWFPYESAGEANTSK